MYVSKRLLTSILVVLAATASLVFAVAASGDRGKGDDEGKGQKLFVSTLAPSVPTDPAFHGVTPGGAPWVLENGRVRIERGGGFDLRVEGLVIPALGTPDGVTTITASLYCGPDANAVPAVTTKSVPLSSSGDARIHEKVALPATCLAPIVLVHPNGIPARYIAVDGWKS